MGSAKRQGALWGQAPSDWAQIQEQQHRPLFETMISAARVREGSRVADLGCGGGSLSMLAAQRGAQISGLDATPGLIDIARARVPAGDFRVGDIQDLPYENDAFDAVIAANSVQFSEDRVATLRELGRVCAPGGRIALGLFGSPEEVEFRHVFQAMRDAMPEPPVGDGPFGLSAPGKLEGLVEEAGLKVVENGVVNCPFVYADFETFWRGQTSAGPTQSLMRAIGEAKLREVMLEVAETYSQEDGRIEIAPNYFKYLVVAM